MTTLQERAAHQALDEFVTYAKALDSKVRALEVRLARAEQEIRLLKLSRLQVVPKAKPKATSSKPAPKGKP